MFPRVLSYVWVSVWVSGCPCVRAYGSVGVWVIFFFVRRPCVPAGLGCRHALLAWVSARLACLGVRPPLNVSTTRGTVPLTMATAQHDRIPSQPYATF